jgi:hypothetical protein
MEEGLQDQGFGERKDIADGADPDFIGDRKTRWRVVAIVILV